MKTPFRTTSAALLLLSATLCQAFPPAPPVTVFGNVRDSGGFLVDADDAAIVFRSGERELQRTPIESVAGAFGENYRTQLALDMNATSGVYRPGVIDAGLPFTVAVEIGGRRYVPIEAQAELGAPDIPGAVIRLDFTLGEDTDGDGLPDDWERWQQQAGGLRPGDAGYGIEHLTPDGDEDGDGLNNRDEYLAGTFAYMGADRLELSIVRMHPDGWLELEFPAVIDKTYRFEATAEGESWSPILAGVDGERLALETNFRASSTRNVRLIIPPAPDNPDRLFRVRVN